MKQGRGQGDGGSPRQGVQQAAADSRGPEPACVQTPSNWIATVLGLLKSGKLRLRRTIDQGNLIKLLGEWYDKFDLITKKFFSTEPRTP